MKEVWRERMKKTGRKGGLGTRQGHEGKWDRSCLVPRPQYYASVIHFGSHGLGQKVWPRQKSEK